MQHLTKPRDKVTGDLYAAIGARNQSAGPMIKVCLRTFATRKRALNNVSEFEEKIVRHEPSPLI
jgi:hypothetical protein